MARVTGYDAFEQVRAFERASGVKITGPDVDAAKLGAAIRSLLEAEQNWKAMTRYLRNIGEAIDGVGIHLDAAEQMVELGSSSS